MNRMIVPPMVGHLNLEGTGIQRVAGFMSGSPAIFDGPRPPSVSLLSRWQGVPQPSSPSAEVEAAIQRLERGEATSDLQQLLFHLRNQQMEFQRAVTSTMTAFPVRENLEAEAKLLIPLRTPVRNKLARIRGAGTASAWRQLTSLGGGWAAGDQPGEGPGAIRSFFAETGAPAEHTSVYAAKSAGYKLMGTFGAVTGFAEAAGMTFQNNFAIERTNSMRNLMLNEENALINGDSTSTAAPWGDGTNALAFDGLVNLITVANGTPTAQVQTSVGALTLAHIDAQLVRLWKQGAQDPWILLNAQEKQSIVNLAQASGTLIRIMATADNDAGLGLDVSWIKHPITGEKVPLMVSQFLAAGTMIFGCDALPDGSPAADVSVLPQVQLPELAPNTMIQGYTAQDLAPAVTAPQVYAWIVTVFEVLRLKSARHFGKSTGVTAV